MSGSMRSETSPREADRPARTRPAFSDHAGARETAIVAGVAAGVGLAAGIVFTLFPQIDLAVSDAFHGGWRAGFPHAGDGWVQALREFFLACFRIWYVVVACCAVLSWRWRAAILGLAPQRWIYMGVCSLAGPLLLVNVVLKEFWGRWRPRDMVEFGGYELFTAPLEIGGSCADNCSFVSGEVASMVMVFMALAFATRHWRPIHYALAVLLGGLEGFIRVSQGGHFLSDAIFACVFMALVAAAIHWAMFLRGGQPSGQPAA